MSDQLANLPVASWRERIFPITSRDVSFAHENAQHKFQYSQNEFVETLGAKSWTFRYTVPMREDLYIGPFKNLFTQELLPLIADMRNKEPGILVDPVMGTFRCKPASLSDSTDPVKRDGTDLTLEFIFSPEFADREPVEENRNNVQTQTAEAEKVDDEIERQDWQNFDPPEPTVDPLSAISGFGRQIEWQGNKTLNALEKHIDRLESVESTLEALSDPSSFALKRRSRRTRELANRVKEDVQSPLRRVRRIVLEYAQTLSQIASAHAMTVVEFLQLNPSLASTPEVAADTPITVFQ